MPELPEATTIARGLADALTGAQVRQVRLLRRDFFKGGRRAELARLAGAWIDGVERRGKWVIVRLDGRRLVLQLGMAGRVYVHPACEPLPPHTHLTIALADGRELRYANSRRIAAGVRLLAPGRSALLEALGPDADEIECAEFVQRLAGRKAPIKAALLNQSILAGVGNIYSDEALFRAGLRPGRRVNRIARRKLIELHRRVREVLTEAIAAGGSTLESSTPFAGPNGEMGYFTHSHQVYGRYGQPCLRCGTVLRRTTIGGRTSSYCPRCQR